MPANEHKIVLVGDTNVGKSSIAIRFAQNRFFENTEPTIGAAFLTKKIRYNETDYVLNLWDTAGQEKYNSLIPMYYRNANAAIIVYDVTNEQSLNSASRWLNELNTIVPDIFILLVGNKCDLENQIHQTNINDYVNKNNIKHLEVSAKTNHNINEMFELILPNLVINDENAPLVHQMEKLDEHDNKCNC